MQSATTDALQIGLLSSFAAFVSPISPASTTTFARRNLAPARLERAGENMTVGTRLMIPLNINPVIATCQLWPNGVQ